ncbi:MAG: M48 family metalloprotease [Alphaproteobacteria bacterium]
MPDVSERDRARASAEIADTAPGHTLSGRSVSENRDLTVTAAMRLKAAAAPICAHAGRTDCVFLIGFSEAYTVDLTFAEADKIFIFEELARLLESEDEFAAILAHDMGHQIAGHIDRARTDNAIGRVIAGTLVLTLDIALGTLHGLAAGNSAAGRYGYSSPRHRHASLGLGDRFRRLTFTTAQECEADYIAAYLLKRAGYDLSVARRVWIQLAHATDGTSAGAFRNHQGSPYRLAAWDKAVAEVETSADLLPVRARWPQLVRDTGVED